MQLYKNVYGVLPGNKIVSICKENNYLKNISEAELAALKKLKIKNPVTAALPSAYKAHKYTGNVNNLLDMAMFICSRSMKKYSYGDVRKVAEMLELEVWVS